MDAGTLKRQPGDMAATASSAARDHRPVAIWLLACAAMIFVMVVVGGVTRLTHSGLSIVHWDPIVGVVPPLNDAEWNAAFDAYQRTPEYRDVNDGMPLKAFKRIYYVEWAHRLLGRLIGVVFLLPFLYFLFRRRIEHALVPKLIAMFVLGGLQGALGWFMVKSGLADIPRVSPYRLTAHLGFAVLIYAYLVWTALSLLYPPDSAASAGARRFSRGVTALIYLMILAGGFVAGTRAGFAYNTFPLMAGKFVPDGLGLVKPWWANPFENPVLVQFDHRMLAYVLLLAVPLLWWRLRREPLTPRARLASHLLLAALALQLTLGITTLLYVVPIPLAAAHQGGAVLLFTVALYLTHALGRAA